MRILLGTATALAIGASSVAMAADLPVKARPMVPVVETWSWTGFYIGLNGGYSWGRSRSDAAFFGPGGTPIVPPPGAVTSSDFNLNGGVFGGQLGYNIQSGSFVWGIETDIQWSGERGSTGFFCPGSGVSFVAVIPAVCVPGVGNVPATLGTALTLEQKIEWFGTLRARAGMLVTPNVLAYVTGGLAYGSVKSDLTLALPGGLGSAFSSASTANAGWTVGGGLEAMFARGWSAKVEYLFMDLGRFSSTVSIPGSINASVSSRVTDNIFRAGINYHFDAGPVIARY